MHIKQIIISGFRSFRSQSEVEPFSPKHNALVGRNGSGKSNFFDAVQFVLLGQRFQNLRQEERQQLLHEGAGANVMAAFVEVIFDNSDGRMAVDGDEVVLRRTIGLKKDEFFLNRKRVNKTEVSSLLESAGFSKSNPYYIVQQGKVNSLCLMKDEERLNLLKEVAGTRVYEERREESLKVIGDTNNKRENIQEVISHIEGRLEELDEEKDELKAYQGLDREHRALEYTLYSKELHKTKAHLDTVENNRTQDTEHAHTLHERVRQTQNSLHEHEQRNDALDQNIQRTKTFRSGLEKDRAEKLRLRAQLELEVKDMEDKVALDKDAQDRFQQELTEVEEQCATTRQELEDDAAPAHEAARAESARLTNRLRESQNRVDELHAKQGRGARFESVELRDQHLQEQLVGLERSLDKHRASIRAGEDQVASIEQQLAQRNEAVRGTENEIEERQQEFVELGQQIKEKVAERDTHAEERKERWRTLEQRQERISECKQNLEKGERDLRAAMPRHIAHGLQAVENIVRQDKLKGYHGPVIENIALKDPKFRTAVEVAAGNQLFHLIVEDDGTAAHIVQKLEKENLGRVTFMPLNKLRVKPVNYPTSEDVRPLLATAIRCDPKVEVAMNQIFGKKLLARNMEVASRYSHESQLDAITLDGDEVNRKGALQGGYHDDRISKLGAIEQVHKSKAQLEGLTREYEQLKKSAHEVDQTVTQAMGQIQKLEAQRGNLRHVIKETKSELQLQRQALETTKHYLASQRAAIPEIRAEAQAVEAQAKAFREELGTPLQASLTAAERRLLDKLTSEISELRVQAERQSELLTQTSEAEQRLRYLLDANLLKRQESIKEKLAVLASAPNIDSDAVDTEDELRAKRVELERVSREEEDVARSLDDSESTLIEHEEAKRANASQLEELRSAHSEQTEQLDEVNKVNEKMLNKRLMLLQKREDNTRKIQQLGSVPSAELEKFKELSIKELMARLTDCNESMSKYSHVNKKALDQYVSFTEQRQTLVDRKTELDKGAESIEELISTLDRQKEEAIMRTFKGVSHHFTEVFQELVPAGSGQLVMRTSRDKQEGDEDGAAAGGDDGATMDVGLTVSEFKGVQVRVKFVGTGEQFLMQQLSGGQKALVALTLIFAIQRSDPAPFYLFDEIDQALDSTYRAAVATLIQRQTNSSQNPAQFITTTFRPELCAVANKHYGIGLQNRNSSIHALNKRDCLAFVAELMTEEEAVGQDEVAASEPGSKKRGRSS